MSDIIPPLPFTLANGTTADATEVMADLNTLRNNININVPSLISGILVLQDLGRTVNGTITFPAKSVIPFIVTRNTTVSPTADFIFTFSGGSPFNWGSISPNFAEVAQNNGLLEGQEYSSSPISLLISSSDWNGASIDTFIYYVTLP